MRKPILVFLVLLLLSVTSLVVVRLIRGSRRPPTAVGWQAHIETLAGDGAPNFREGGNSTQAGFAEPFGIVIAPDGSAYVTDAGDSNRIRKIAPDGIVTTLAGGSEGYADGTGSQASFDTPSGIALDADGNLYVADTGNNRIRKISPGGSVSTVAGDGIAGYVDGPAAQARFDGPIGVAVDANGNVYVADTYNDRIRMISTGGQVSTVAGPTAIEGGQEGSKQEDTVASIATNSERPGYADGDARSALFDTPCGIIVAADRSLIVADTGNNQLRKITPEGQVTTVPVLFQASTSPADLRKPLGLSMTHDGFIYLSELDRARIIQVAPDGTARVIAGENPGSLNQPSGLALDLKGDLYVADSGNYLVRKLSHSVSDSGAVVASAESSTSEPARINLPPRLTPETLGQQQLPWPLEPQDRPHEVVATMGEVRGSFDSSDSRERLHSGLDVFGAYGEVVRTIRSEKVTSPLANWGFGDINEGLRVGVVSYIHIHVGREQDGKTFDDRRFMPVPGADGKVARVRVRRGTSFRPGDALGTVNRMYHVHLNVGPPRAEINPLSLSLIGFTDRVAPTIEKDGIQLFDESGARLQEKQSERLVVRGRVRIVVDAFDRNDMNAARRRLGLYRLGYQVLRADGTSVPGFEAPRLTIEFNRLPVNREAPKLTYAEESGITVYGSATTRFLYEVTNTVRDGRASPGFWDTSELSSGEYILRIIVADYSGNETKEDLPVLVR